MFSSLRLSHQLKVLDTDCYFARCSNYKGSPVDKSNNDSSQDNWPQTTTTQSKSSTDEATCDSPKDGSPPMATIPPGAKSTQSTHSDYFPAPEHPPLPSNSPPPNNVTRPPPPTSHPAKGGTRSVSKGGGMQVVLDETGSWSQLKDQTATMPAEGVNGVDGKGSKQAHGMLGFLSRHKGREKSPKPQEPGVLGKEGARVVISSGAR